MTQLVILQNSDGAAMDRWLQALSPTDVVRAANVALVTFGASLSRDLEGRTAGALSGVLFNDLEIAQELGERGLVEDGASHPLLWTTAIAQSGPHGLAGLRAQGVGAVMHLAQRSVLAATGSVGVGPLYLARCEPGWVATTDSSLLAKLGSQRPPAFDDAAPPVHHWVGAETGWPGVQRVVAGTLLLMTPQGPRLERVRWLPRATPYYREPPDVLAQADAATAAILLSDAIGEAAAAAQRGRGRLWLGPAHNTCQQWLRRMAQQRKIGQDEADAECRWSFLGARTLTERMRWPQGLQQGDDTERTERLQAAWMNGFCAPMVRPPLAEPTSRVSSRRAAQRWLRHTAFAHALAARAWQRAADQGWSVTWPHLDPHVLAVAGALPESVLQAAVDRVSSGELAQA